MTEPNDMGCGGRPLPVAARQRPTRKTEWRRSVDLDQHEHSTAPLKRCDRPRRADRAAGYLAGGTRLEDVPPPVREHAKHLILDGVACALVGAQLPGPRKGVQAITALDDAWHRRADRVGRPDH